MNSVSDIVAAARQHLRDFPEFFQLATACNGGITYKMPHRNVDGSTLWVAIAQQPDVPATPLTASDYVIDERNGIIRLATAPSASDTLLVEGYYYEWLLDADLTFFAKIVLNEMKIGVDINPGNALDAVIDLMAVGTVVDALWSLLTEFARDIDVHTPEGVSIPARQRFQMTWTLWSQWEAQYKEKAAQLNVGLGRIEVYKMRRVSRTYNRLVPLYRDKEIGDISPPERLWPAIPSGVASPLEQPEPVEEYVDVAEVPRTRAGLWPWNYGGNP
jgi:hypothetical protein